MVTDYYNYTPCACRVAFVGGKTLHSTGQVNKPEEVKVYPPLPTLPKKTPPAFADSKGTKQQEEDKQGAVEPVGNEHYIHVQKLFLLSIIIIIIDYSVCSSSFNACLYVHVHVHVTCASYMYMVMNVLVLNFL